MTHLLEMLRDPVALTRLMLGTNTVNPPGDETRLCDVLEPLLQALGLATERHPLAPGRETLVGFPRAAAGPLLGFTGHLDTVPLGAAPWRTDPWGGTTEQGRLYGRGTSDMKGGIAAFLVALARLRRADAQRPLPVVLVLTAGEETGCEGAWALPASLGARLPIAALLVGEPTGNELRLGHKGALWLKAQTRGTTAHASTPELGDNAIFHASDAIQAARRYDIRPGLHPLLGAATLNVGTVRGGLNVNSVPDFAEFGIDIRTVDPAASVDTAADLGAYLGDKVRLLATLSVPALLTDAADPWMRHVERCIGEVRGAAPAGARTAAFFTDGPALRRIFGDVPTAILGPGEPGCAHITDEYIDIDRLHEGVQIYERIVRHQLSCTDKATP